MPARMITCSVCGYGVIRAKGGNLVKSSDIEYRHEDPIICNEIKKTNKSAQRARVKKLGLVIPKQGLIISK